MRLCTSTNILFERPEGQRAPECEIDALLRKSYELGVKMAGEQR